MRDLIFENGITLAGIHYPGPVYVEASLYMDLEGGAAIILTTTEDGYQELLTKVTVNMTETGHRPIPGAVFVKDYSENAGVLDAFEKAGWMSRTGRVVENGFVTISEAMLIGGLEEVVAARKARGL